MNRGAVWVPVLLSWLPWRVSAKGSDLGSSGCWVLLSLGHESQATHVQEGACPSVPCGRGAMIKYKLIPSQERSSRGFLHSLNCFLVSTGLFPQSPVYIIKTLNLCETHTFWTNDACQSVASQASERGRRLSATFFRHPENGIVVDGSVVTPDLARSSWTCRGGDSAASGRWVSRQCGGRAYHIDSAKKQRCNAFRVLSGSKRYT